MPHEIIIIYMYTFLIRKHLSLDETLKKLVLKKRNIYKIHGMMMVLVVVIFTFRNFGTKCLSLKIWSLNKCKARQFLPPREINLL